MDESNSTPTIISRKDAKARGLKRYFDGNPCKRGHVAERYTSTGHCIPCAIGNSEAWSVANPERKAENARKFYVNNIDSVKEKALAYREAHRDKAIETSRAWRENNPGRLAAVCRAWAAANKEKCKSLRTAWREANREKVRSFNRNRKARQRNAEGSHTAQDVADLLAAQKGRCAYCKVKVGGDYHVDHIQPLIKGGRNDRENLQICCPACNLRKRDKDPITFAQSLGLLL